MKQLVDDVLTGGVFSHNTRFIDRRQTNLSPL